MVASGSDGGRLLFMVHKLIGRNADNSGDCEAFAGTARRENMLIPEGPPTDDIDIINATKTVEDDHWTHTITDLNGRLRNDFLARRLLTDFYCYFPELRE